MKAIQPWERIGSTPVADFRIFTVRSDRKVSPRTHQEHDFFVIDCVNWVNVVALTPDDQVVMVEQYRHGTNTVELEIPGGMIDADDASPEAAGQRELREETGYAGQNARLIGRVFPNPAIMSNVCFTVLVENCRCAHALEWDGRRSWSRASCRSPTACPRGRRQHSPLAGDRRPLLLRFIPSPAGV